MDQHTEDIVFKLKEIQCELGRNGSQTTQVFKDTAVDALICQKSNIHDGTEEALQREEANNPKYIWVMCLLETCFHQTQNPCAFMAIIYVRQDVIETIAFGHF